MTAGYLKVFSTTERVAFKALRLVGYPRWFYSVFERVHRDTPQVSAFRNLHQGDRCFILGGGPSLKEIDPVSLRHEVTFGVNGIFLIYDWLGFEPTYYVVEDFLVYEDRWRDIKNHVNRSECFFPVQFRAPEFDRSNHIYFRAIYDFSPRSGFPRFSRNAAKLMWIGGTVTFICLQLAFYMGFREVYLLGMDHNYLKPDHVSTRGEVWQSNGDDPNHFHPDYFGAGYRWHDPQVHRMEQAYVKAKQVFEADNRAIVNATVGGNLEVFPRIAYEELFQTP